jgi:outer membrane protein assembly factor BamB
MHRTRLPKAIFLLIYTALLFAAGVVAQEKGETELVVTRCWSYPLESGKTLAADGARIFLGTTDAKVDAVSLDGKKLWASELGGEIASSILSTETGILIATTSTNGDGRSTYSSLRVLSKDSGITSQAIRLPDASGHFLALAQTTVVIVSTAGVVQSIDVKTGAVKWKREIADAFVGEPYFNADRLIVASNSRQLFHIALATGEIESMQKFEMGATVAAETTTGDLITGDERGSITSFSQRSDKAIWRYKSGAFVSSLRNIKDHLLVTSHDNFVYYLTLPRGGLEWKKRLAGRVSHVAIIENALALVSSVEENGATFIDLKTGKSVGQIALDEGEFLVANPISSSGLIIVLTNKRAITHSFTGCVAKKEGEHGK